MNSIVNMADILKNIPLTGMIEHIFFQKRK